MALNFDVITCPTCGAEYLSSEIFIPKEFFGKPWSIERDINHKIIDVAGARMCTSENYICDYCNVPFKVFAKISFNTKSDVKLDFNNDYSTSLKRMSLFMNEDDD